MAMEVILSNNYVEDAQSYYVADKVTGRTRCNRVVNFDGRGHVAVGDVTRLTITEALPHSLRGTLASQAEEAVCLSR